MSGHPITFWIDQSCGKKKMIVVFILLFIRLQLILVGVYILMVGKDAIEIASDAILITSQQSTDHILAGQTATR